MKIGQLIIPVDDISAALAFYHDSLGLQVRFRDGDRYAAVHDGAATLALAAPREQSAPGRVHVAFKVDDVAATAERLRARGVTVGPVTRGEHELRAVAEDPFGNPLVLYGPLTA